MKKIFKVFLSIGILISTQITWGQNSKTLSQKLYKNKPPTEQCGESLVFQRTVPQKKTVEAVCLEQINSNAPTETKSEQSDKTIPSSIRLSNTDFELNSQPNVQLELSEPTTTYTIIEPTIKESEGITQTQNTEGKKYSNYQSKNIEDYTAEELLKIYQIGNEQTKAKILANPVLKEKLITTNIKID